MPGIFITKNLRVSIKEKLQDNDVAVDPTKKIVSLHAFLFVHRFLLLFFTHTKNER